MPVGDVRVNMQPALSSLNTIWMREHNRLADALSALNAGVWDDEVLFQETRKIVMALHQHITYNEFLPEFLGPQYMKWYVLYQDMLA